MASAPAARQDGGSAANGTRFRTVHSLDIEWYDGLLVLIDNAPVPGNSYPPQALRQSSRSLNPRVRDVRVLSSTMSG